MLNSRRKVLWHCGHVAFTSSPSAGVVTGADRTTFTLAITGFFSSTLCSSLCAARELWLVNLEEGAMCKPNWQLFERDRNDRVTRQVDY